MVLRHKHSVENKKKNIQREFDHKIYELSDDLPKLELGDGVGRGRKGERQIIRHTAKVKDEVGMKKIAERDRQFLVEKIIHGVEFSNPYENSIEKKPEIIETVESNYRIIRRVYQLLYSDVADIFFEYIHSPDPDEIQQLDEDLKSNGWGAINILEI